MSASATWAAVVLWSRSEVQRRWRALVLLGVLAGLAGGLVTAALEGANRTSSSYQRMREELRGADVIFFPSQVGVWDTDVTLLDQIPEVESWGGFSIVAGQLLELPPGTSPLIFVGSDWFDSIERAKVVEGRLPDPSLDDEMVINEEAVKADPNARVGRTFTFRTLDSDELARYGEAGPPDWSRTEGPAVTMRIVGVVRQPMSGAASFASGPLAVTGPGWAAAHLDETPPFFTNAVVRLRGGAADVPAFKEGLARVYGRSDLPVKDLQEDIKRVENSTDLERTGLLLFAAAVLIASVVLVGQAFLRSAHVGAEAVPTLRSMGLAPRSLAAGLALPHALTVLVAMLVTVVTTAALSPRFPIGLARRLDPDLAFSLRPSYLLAGAAAVGVATIGAALLSAGLATRAGLGRTRARRARMVGAASRAGAPVPAAVGASLALEQPERAGTAQVRPALIAGIGAVLGVVGAVTLVGGIDDALAHPARSGMSWHIEIDGADDEIVQTVRQDERVRDAARVRRVADSVDGHDAPVYAVEPLQGDMHFSVLEGRSPEGGDEVLLGARTARVLDASIGDTVVLGVDRHRARVVGVGLLLQTPHGAFDEGALVSPATFHQLYPPDPESIVLLGVPRPTDREALLSELTESGAYAYPPAPVPDVANLANVRRLPYLLAAFLVLLGIGTAAHALLTVSSRRRKELAVLRALGLTPRQAGSCVAWQAVVVATIALAIGLPLGLLVGRQAWHRVAEAVPLVYVGPLEARLMLVAIPCALAGLLLLALAPARRVARLHPAEVLRAE